MGETEQLEDVGYLQDIINYIFDEKKIVTYKWISNVFAIHVNRAKQLLYTFIKHISEEKLKDLEIIYFIGGILPDDKGYSFQVVPEKDLEKVAAKFKVITSKHIYSVCLKNCLSDLFDLCSIDGVKNSKVTRNGAILCSKGVQRASAEMLSKRQSAYTHVDDEKKWPAEKPKQLSACNSDKKPSKAAKGISAMFSAQKSKEKAEESANLKKPEEEQKQKTATSPEKKVPAPKNAPKNGKPPGGRLAAMFSAQNAKPKPVKKDNQEESKANGQKETDTPVSKEDLSSPEKKNNKSGEKKQSKPDESKNNKSSEKKDNKIVSEKTSKSSKSGSKSKQKKRKTSDNANGRSKKRKRIVVMDESDSSSDDIFASDEEEAPPSPVPVIDEEMEEPIQIDTSKETEPSTTEKSTKDHHGRKRRLVDKTFMDEDGYMVTKKEYEFESCSESENEEKENENEKSVGSKVKKKEDEPTPNAIKSAEKPQKKNMQRKSSSPEKKKQATLMNFFKRS